MNWKYILIIIILAVIVGGGILAYQCWWLPKEEAKIWKTYRNEKYSIEFQYPNSWILDDKEALSIKLPDQTKNFIQINVSNGVSGPEDKSMSPCQSGIASMVYQVGKLRDSQQTFEEFVNFQIENPERGMSPAVKPKLIQTTIGEHNALKIKETINSCKKEFYYVEQSSDRYMTISFIVDKDEDKMIIDRIFSTLVLLSPEVKEPEEITKLSVEISFQKLLEMSTSLQISTDTSNALETEGGIGIVKLKDDGFINSGIYQTIFIYNDKTFALISDVSEQGMKGGTTIHYLQKINANGNKEDIRNSLGGVEKWNTGGTTGKVVIAFQGKLYFIMSAREGNDSLIIIKAIGEDDIVKDTLEIKGAKLAYSLGESRGSILIVGGKLYFKLLEDCSLEGFAKEVCYTSYYLFGEDGSFIKSDIFEKEKIELLHG